jgi:hypothetical protein
LSRNLSASCRDSRSHSSPFSVLTFALLEAGADGDGFGEFQPELAVAELSLLDRSHVVQIEDEDAVIVNVRRVEGEGFVRLPKNSGFGREKSWTRFSASVLYSQRCMVFEMRI